MKPQIITKEPLRALPQKALPKNWLPHDFLSICAKGHTLHTITVVRAAPDLIVLECSCGQVVEVDHDAEMVLGENMLDMRKRLDRFVPKAMVQ